jgi:hypothetical protein
VARSRESVPTGYRQAVARDRRCVFFGWLFVIIIIVLVLAVIGFMSLIRGRA